MENKNNPMEMSLNAVERYESNDLNIMQATAMTVVTIIAVTLGTILGSI